MNYRLFFICAALSLFACGCAAQQRPAGQGLADPVYPPIVIPADKPPAQGVAGLTVTTAATGMVEQLTLADALSLAIRHNPTLAAFAEEIRARDAAALQAGLPPNPDLDLELENFGGQDELQDLEGAETTIALSQLIELGGKRSKRRQVASLEKELAGWDYRSSKLDVLAATARSFIQVLAAQQQVALNQELVSLAEKTQAAVGERVEAGKVSPLENSRVQVELAAARSEANRAQRELAAARLRLGAAWGMAPVKFDRVVGDLAAVQPLPPAETVQDLLADNPDLLRWQSERERHEAALALASSQALPDLSLKVGVRNFQDTDSNALMVGIQVPLPFFNRNQGGVAEARAKLRKSRELQQAAEAELRTGLGETWQMLTAAYVEAVTIRDQILPGAQEAYEATAFGYREGKFDLLEMLDSQRTLFTVKRQYLQALETYHLAQTELQRFTGAAEQAAGISASENN
ncbi:MAG: TolC family protein [Desulfurivibrio sp.]|nr:MAG: TolC family protein [Desulfurivibrio sp.]